MKCAAFHKLIGDRLDGTIRPAERARLDAHLKSCGECRELLEDFQKITESARALDDRDTPSEDVWPARPGRGPCHPPRGAASRRFIPRWAYAAGSR